MPSAGIYQVDLFWSSLAALLVMVLPGWALLDRLPVTSTSQRIPGLARLADAIGLSISITALVGLLLFLPGVRLNGWAIVILYGLLILLVVEGLLRRGLPRFELRGLLLAGLGGLLVVLLVAWRFYQARSLALPLWVDSVHHALVVRKMVEWGGIPPDMQPYMPVPFFYHYGFHLVTAVFAAAARLTPDQAVLWLGQVMNAGVALSVYRLGVALQPESVAIGEPRKGVAAITQRLPRMAPLLAVLLVGFAFQMPAYYLSWGRYTLLAGLLILGPALAAACDLRRSPRDRSAMVRLTLLIAGICLTHYLALLLAILFLLVLGLAGVVRAVLRRSLAELPWAAAGCALGGVLLAAPWLWRLYSYGQHYATIGWDIPQDPLGTLKYISYLLGPRHSHALLILAGVGLLFSLGRGRFGLLTTWALLLAGLSTPWSPRLGPFRPDLYAIVLFFPAALLLSDLLTMAADALGRVWRPLMGLVGLVLTAGGLLVWGLFETQDVVNETTAFTTTADVAALEWVKENTPPASRFYINSVVWQWQTYRGVDGGFWLMPYTGRTSLVPPVFYGYGSPEYIQTITDWAKRSSEIAGCTPQFWDLMRDAELTHIYLRAGSGSLQPAQLADCPRLKQVYSRAGVTIFERQLP